MEEIPGDFEDDAFSVDSADLGDDDIANYRDIINNSKFTGKRIPVFLSIAFAIRYYSIAKAIPIAVFIIV